MKNLSLLLTALLLSFYSNAQEELTQVSVDVDTIRSTLIKSLFNDNSTVVLEYQKRRYSVPEMSNIVDERIVYLDFGQPDTNEAIASVNTQLNDIFSGKSYLRLHVIGNRPKKSYNVRNLANIYVPVHRLNGEYVLFKPDLDHPRIISDTAIFFKDDEGLTQHFLTSFSRTKDNYHLSYDDAYKTDISINIRHFDTIYNVLAWREKSENGNSREVINYKLYVPLASAKNLPILDIINTAGLDEVYLKFDDLQLETQF